MDKINRLQALLGEEVTSEESYDWNRHAHAKPTHLYEGTDSDDDEVITSGKLSKAEYDALKPIVQYQYSK